MSDNRNMSYSPNTESRTPPSPTPFPHVGKVESTVLVDNEAAVAHVKATTFDKAFYATSASKKHPKDNVNLEIGASLALGRALVALGEEILRSANYEVAQADWVQS